MIDSKGSGVNKFFMPRNNTGFVKLNAPPEVVGYWLLGPDVPGVIALPVYGMPTDEQIKNTEALLGWAWRCIL